MASRSTRLGINGSGARKSGSWIGSFIEHTSFLESAPLFRKWVAIATVGAVLERRVWIDTGSPLYPNLYVFLVGAAAAGKSRPIDEAGRILRELPDFFLSPTSMSRASLVDTLVESKRSLVQMGMTSKVVEYNTLFILVDELTALMDQWNTDLTAALTKFYDCNPYAEAKRRETIRNKLDAPQVSLCCGITPLELMNTKTIPANAWGQGFMSRIILIYTKEKGFRNILDRKPNDISLLVHDLQVIGSSFGEIKWDKGFEEAFHAWREQGEQPVPTHPRLVGYCGRRYAHVLKLSMIACLDQSGKLLLTQDHFNTALLWLLEAETTMPGIFSAGYTSVDAQAMDEIEDFIRRQGRVVHHKLVHFTAGIVPSHSVMRVIEIMTLSGRIKRVGEEKGHGIYEAP